MRSCRFSCRSATALHRKTLGWCVFALGAARPKRALTLAGSIHRPAVFTLWHHGLTTELTPVLLWSAVLSPLNSFQFTRACKIPPALELELPLLIFQASGWSECSEDLHKDMHQRLVGAMAVRAVILLKWSRVQAKHICSFAEL